MSERAPIEPPVFPPPGDDRFLWSRITIREDCRKQAVEATMNVSHALYQAATIFEFLGLGQSMGYFDNSPAFSTTVAEICGDHFKALAERHDATLNHLYFKLKDAEPVPDSDGTQQEGSME